MDAKNSVRACVGNDLDHSVEFVEGEYDLGVYYRSMRSSGDHYNLGRIIVTPRANGRGMVPFAPEHRGVVELSHTITVLNGPTADLTRASQHHHPITA